jgi:hypothetical protein
MVETDERLTDFTLPVFGLTHSGLLPGQSASFSSAPSSGNIRISCQSCKRAIFGLELRAIA